MQEINLALIKQRRKEMRLTTQEMADLIGLKTAANYWKYENGVYKFKAEHIPVVAKKLKLNMNQIFFAA